MSKDMVVLKANVPFTLMEVSINRKGQIFLVTKQKPSTIHPSLERLDQGDDWGGGGSFIVRPEWLEQRVVDLRVDDEDIALDCLDNTGCVILVDVEERTVGGKAPDGTIYQGPLDSNGKRSAKEGTKYVQAVVKSIKYSPEAKEYGREIRRERFVSAPRATRSARPRMDIGRRETVDPTAIPEE